MLAVVHTLYCVLVVLGQTNMLLLGLTPSIVPPVMVSASLSISKAVSGSRLPMATITPPEILISPFESMASLLFDFA